MIDRRLVLMMSGAPMMQSLTVTPIRVRILEWPDDDCDLFQVFTVPEFSHTPAFDITEGFAENWGREIVNDHGFGGGIEPEDYLAPLPAFVRTAAREKMVLLWQKRMAERDANFMPAVLRSVA